jgi:hypothetical protein
MRAHRAWHREPLAILPAAAGQDVLPCLVHLVRKANGLDWLREFADALRLHPPGIDHELVFAMKGFSSPDEARPYLDEVADLAPKTLFFPDRGFDLGVYFATAASLRRGRYCFVNSHSRPVSDGWLSRLDSALSRPGVGQVGASGSWTSNSSSLMYWMGLPSAYTRVMPPRTLFREQLGGIRAERSSIDALKVDHPYRMRLKTLVEIPRTLLGYPPFPAPHLRSNVFMITQDALRELPLFAVYSKLGTSMLESGRRSLTRQLERNGLASLVVDRAGAVYATEQWHRSRTFWQGDQEGLLVADNQTLAYTRGDFARRRLLSASAWGRHAAPTPPREGSVDASGFAR